MKNVRRLALAALAASVCGWLGAVSCVEGHFAEGLFLCDPAAGAEACPPGMICAADGRCRSQDVVGPSGGAGGTGGTTSSGGATTTTTTAGGGGAAGAGGVGGGGGATGGGGGCVPKTCTVDYPGICGLQDDGCGSQIDCGCVACTGTQTRAPLLVANSSNLGTIPWVNENLAALEDGQYAAAGGIPANAETHRLYGYHYQFDVPTQAAIDSISLRVVRRASTVNTVVDQAVRLMLHGTQPVGNDKSSLTGWPASFTSATYTWTQSGVTIAQLVANSFGAAVRARNDGNINAAARVDYLELTVVYSCP